MSNAYDNLYVLPYAAREERIYDGHVEMLKHLPAHPRAHLIKRVLGENGVLKGIQPYTYQMTEWFVGKRAIDSAYALVLAPDLRLFQKYEIIAVGNEPVYEFNSERQHIETLVALMEDPPFHADFIFEERPEYVRHRMNPFSHAMRLLLGIREKPAAIRHRFSFYRLKVRAVPPSNVVHFDQKRRKRKI